MRGDNAQANGPFRVLLANDHTMFCQGLAGILAAYGGMEVVAEVPNDKNNLRYVSWLSGGWASAYLLKTASAEHLIAAVRATDLDPEGATPW